MTRFVCPDCNRHVTRGPDGVEYGHSKGTDKHPRCPRRPDCVDPKGGFSHPIEEAET